MKKLYLFIGVLSFFFFLAAAPLKNREKPGMPIPSFKSNLTNYNLPVDAGSPTDLTALAAFAWQEMIALNWKSTYKTTAYTGKDKRAVPAYERAMPDKAGWNYSTPAIPDGDATGTVVWETYAHRTELRPANTSAAEFDSIKRPFDAVPVYTFGTAGKPVAVTADKGASLNLFNCLDEDNEIGSCLLFVNVNDTSEDHTASLRNEVLFQAKINRTGFEYRKNFNSNTRILGAAKKVVNPAKGAVNPDLSLLAGKTSSCDSKGLTAQGYICFPCAGDTSEGVIEIKTAWIRYDPAIHNLNDYFHRTAIYFKDKNARGAFVAKNDTFLLVGMHIIRKTKNVPTFIIATFEHNGVEGDNFKYVSKPGGDGDYSELWKISRSKRRTTDKGYDQHKKLYRDVTEQMWSDLRAVNPNHYLLHYNLVGVQGNYSRGYPADKNEPSFFMSNYAVESDNALSSFYGNFALPQQGRSNPGFFNLVIDAPVPGISKPMGIVAGGCKGCHGVTQTAGTDMSFLMDATKPVPEPDVSFLSAAQLDSVLFSPVFFLNPPPGTVPANPPFVLSYVENGRPLYYVLRSDVRGNILTVIPYDTDFKTYRGLPGVVDVDNYPLANFTFYNYKRLTDSTATAQLRYNPGPLEPQDTLYVGYPALPPGADKSELNNNFLGLFTKPTNSTFTIKMRKGGIIELSTKLGPVIKNGFLATVAPSNPYPFPVAQFVINGVDKTSFNLINGIR